MSELWQLLGALVLLLIGLRLSAFFSGSETGFYRISFLRLIIESNAGDRTARRILWFARNPGYFVATVLVGNNVANYITTLAIGLGVTALLHSEHAWVEVASTVLFSPVVFVAGELVPKNLYYLAPMHWLRRDIRWFIMFYRLFLVVSFPLIWISKLFERFGEPGAMQRESVLGRQRLLHLLARGRQEGLLTDVQGRLVNGLLQTTEQPVKFSMTPADRVFGINDGATRDEAIECGRQYGLTSIAVREDNAPDSWYGYVPVADVVISAAPWHSLIRPMPRLASTATKLQAIIAMRDSQSLFATVCEGETVLGIVSERGLIEQLLRTTPGTGPTMQGGTAPQQE
jgi:CBS domain containing-hemolysin-like protein